MKIRNGFVSNSSSSSFVVATTGNTQFQITIDVDLKEYVDHTIKNEEELKKIFINDYGYREEDLKNDKEYQKCLNAIKNGKTILLGHFSDDCGNDISSFLCNNGLPENIKSIEIITNEPGY